MPFGESTSAEVERIAAAIVDAAFKVHTTLGPGLLESVYVACLAHELRKRGFRVQCQQWVPIVYDGMVVADALRMDLLVNELVVVEVKAAEKLNPIYEAQTQTYVKLAKLSLGFLINFNVVLIKNGIKRILPKTTRETSPNSLQPDVDA
jgi:GxxExxY protein